jgi:NTE family protein
VSARVAVLLSGGGAKAAAHAGALEALAEAGLAPTWLVGTSMGAVVGACFAAGLGREAILDRVGAIGSRGIVRAPWAPFGGLWLRSLLRGEPLRDGIAALVPARSFDELKIPLVVTAVDLDTGVLVRFGPGGESAPLVDALWASCALPVFYPPVGLGGRRLVDGGLRGVVPFEAAADVPADLVVAVDVGPGFDEPAAPAASYPALVGLHNDTTGVLMAALTAAELALWRATPGRAELVYVRPRVERSATFRVDRAREYAAEGYRATAAALEAREARARS